MKLIFKEQNKNNLFTVKLLSNNNSHYEIHQLVSNLNEDSTSQERILWRIENEGKREPYLIVQTNFQPNIERLKNHINFSKIFEENFDIKCINFNPKKDEKFIFKIRTNPTKNIIKEKIGNKSKHKRIAITDTSQNENNSYISEVQKWFIKKAQLHGFSILDFSFIKENHLDLEITKNKLLKAKYNSILYTGTLKVKDPILFKTGFENGIGNAKMLGFGLLSLKRIVS